MPKNNNISEEDYLDSLLRSVSGQTEDFDLDKELGITDEFDSDFETEFEAQLEKEFAIEDTDSEITTASLFDEEETVPIEINSKNQETEMAESNSIFTDDDTSTESEEEPVLNEVLDDDELANLFVGNDFEEDYSPFTDTEAVGEPKQMVTEKPADVEANDITVGLESIMGVSPVMDKKALKEAKKAEKARIKANQKAIREAEKIARLAEKADALEKGANNSSVSSVKAAPASINDVFESAGARNREDDYETGGRTAEEKSIDNSVDDELAGLGLDNFFGEIEEEPTNQNDNFSSYGNIAREEEPDDDSDEEEISSIKEKKTKPAKAKKPKKVKPPKPSKQKKPKKPKEPDEIIMLPKGLIILGLSFTVLIAAVATVGGNYSHYNKCMAKAVAYYVDKDYKSAYSQLAGLKIREEDEFFYQQLKVVMNVEANYDLFKSYMRIGLFEEALDALLKGVDNFDLYQNEARDWEAFDDLEVSLRRVVNALNKYFGITESRAREINLTDSQREYSKIVAELAANVVYDKNEPFEDETTTAGEIPSSDSGEDETTDESAGDNSEE